MKHDCAGGWSELEGFRKAAGEKALREVGLPLHHRGRYKGPALASQEVTIVWEDSITKWMFILFRGKL